ncbi:MAG: pyruvate kinase [Ruminococcaceae bacterium]|nr:pyruvate kinase [Oscillospiraceae bacterium]
MRKTKIICTVGPACANEETLTRMVKAGMNVARFNFSHETHETHRRVMDMVKRVRDKLQMPVAILLDTKGPEYRIGTFREGKVTLQAGDTFVFTGRAIEGDAHGVSVSYPPMIRELDVGDTILLNNGLMAFEVVSLTETDAVCRVTVGGELSNRKSMSIPDKVFSQPYLSEQDRADLLFGIEMGVDFVACSFVSRPQDIDDVRDFMNAHGGEDIDLIAKIENRAGVDNIDEIIDRSNGIMIARGDMGVEIPYEQLPAIQKHLITTCRYRGKRVITATEMLESMIDRPRPTRAEISDVANAVYDGTSALMLSGETAAGKHPVEAVEAMSRIAEQTEQNINYSKRFRNSDFRIKSNIDAISHATCALAIDVDAKLMVVCTLGGGTARMVSRFRSPMPIIGMTTNERVWRKLALSWAVIPVLSEEFPSTEVLFYHAAVAARRSGLVQAGDHIVITGGITNGTSGNTNLIKLETV